MADLVQRIGGQHRAAASGVIGLDMGAVLAMARALGAPEGLVAEVVTEVEHIAVKRINAQISEAGDG